MMHPPKWPVKFLRWFCKPYYADTIEGDLYEIFYRDTVKSSWGAKWRFTLNVLRFFKWRFLKSPDDFQPKSSFGMFKNYLKVSLRNIKKHKVHSLLNITGLSVGIAASLLILLHVTTQVRYDKHIPELERIYRVTLNNTGPYTPARLVKQMSEDYPEIEAGTRVNGTFDMVIKTGNDFIVQDGGVIADSTFFDVFPAEFVIGDPKTCLNRPNTVVLTTSVAEKLFKDQNPIGKEIETGSRIYEVTAVVADPPKTSTIPYKLIRAIPHAYWATTGWWTGNNFFSYLKLKENTDPVALESKFQEFVRKHVAPEILKFSDQYDSFDEYLASGRNHMYTLVPMADIHLQHPRLSLGNPGSYQNVLIFSMIAFFILIIASINYINMSTARSSLRAKEIGMRKVLGSNRKSVAGQFLVESYLVTFISVLSGAIIAVFILPYFNSVSLSTYEWTELFTMKNIAWMIGIFLFVGMLSGSYPSVYLSSFQPLTALRGEKVGSGRKWIRVGLVVFQFTISILMISGTFIVFHQVSHMSNRNLGLNADQTFIIEGGTLVDDQFTAFKDELEKFSAIENVAISNHYPSSFIADWNYKTLGENAVTVSPFNLIVDANVADVWGLEIQEGRFFKSDLVSDTASVVINQKLAEDLGWEEPVGMQLERQDQIFRVIGVVNNFATGSAKRSDYPLIMRYESPERMSTVSGSLFISAKVMGNYRESIAHMEDTWGKFVTNYPFEGYFMDDSFERLYDSERSFGKMFSGFSILAILIACIGLFALASFTMERRLKELAIRKVLGATSSRLVNMIIVDFLKFIVLAAVIAAPMIYYLANYWLNDYVDRISLNPAHFLLPVIVVIVISVLTIGYQAYKTAIDDPVKALKYE